MPELLFHGESKNIVGGWIKTSFSFSGQIPLLSLFLYGSILCPHEEVKLL